MNHATCRAMIVALLALPCAATGHAGPIRSDIKPVPTTTLADSITVRHEMFTLANGLRVVVQHDPTVQTITIGVEYAIGSSAEMPGRTGFAHLFEHLMFNGSENVPVDFSIPMQALGATINGVTQADRTAYLSVVPMPSVERALFLKAIGWDICWEPSTRPNSTSSAASSGTRNA